MSRYYSIFVQAALVCVIGLPTMASSEEVAERREMVAMRAIGHAVLLSVGDSTSRVLPVQMVDDQYKISFESDFAFVPEALVASVNTAAKGFDVIDRYLVEVKDCDKGEVVYAYELATSDNTEALQCASRGLPTACYALFVTLLNDHDETALEALGQDHTEERIGQKNKNRDNLLFMLLIIPVSLVVAFSVRIWKKRQGTNANPELIAIGEYQFDKRNMELHRKDEKTELTSKEADLLALLHARANNTVERDVMLKEVWGDEGDYIGRTLDVFISKLRKKLEADPSIRIANIRGVGYKLILNN